MTRMTQSDERVNATLIAPARRYRAAAPTRMHILTPDGVNHGGSCTACGAAMGFWYNTKLCDTCIAGGRRKPERKPEQVAQTGLGAGAQ